MKNAASWEADFCNHMAEVESSTRVWLDTLVQHTQLQENQTTGQSPAEVRAKMSPSAHHHHHRRHGLAVIVGYFAAHTSSKAGMLPAFGASETKACALH